MMSNTQQFHSALERHLGDIKQLCESRSIEGALKHLIRAKKLPAVNVSLYISHVAELLSRESTSGWRMEAGSITKREGIILGLVAITNPYRPDDYWMLQNVQRDFDRNPERDFRIVKTPEGLEAWAKPVARANENSHYSNRMD